MALPPPATRLKRTWSDGWRGQDPRAIDIAWRAQKRLHRRWQHLHDERGKRATIVAVAVARELTSFCWEIAMLD